MNASVSKLFVKMCDNIRHAMSVIDQSGTISLALIVDDDFRLLNTITDGDVRRGILAGLSLDDPVSCLVEIKLNTPHPWPVIAPIGSDPRALKALMEKERIRQLPLLHANGMIHDVAVYPELADKLQKMDVNALIMAGGRGIRLSPLTDDTPKPLLPINGVPILKILVDQIVSCGIKDIYVSVHYLAEKIMAYFETEKGCGAVINYLQEYLPLGTAGALGLMPKPYKTTLVINGDVLTSANLRTIINFHKDNEAALTMGVVGHLTKIPFGVVECQGLRVTKVREKPDIKSFVSAGIYIVEPHVFDYIEIGCEIDAPDLVCKLLENRERVVGFPIIEQWTDIGEHHSYRRVQSDHKDGKYEVQS